MNRAAFLLCAALGLSGCKDDTSYPGCASVWWCDFDVSSWNIGSSNFWIYGANDDAFYYYDGALLGIDYVSVSRDAASACAGFDRHDVLTWDRCAAELPEFNCDFVSQAKQVYATRSSATAGQSDIYSPGPGGPLDFDCTRADLNNG